MILFRLFYILVIIIVATSTGARGQKVKDLRHKITSSTFEGDQSKERAYYEIQSIPLPAGMVFEGAGLDVLPGGRLAIGTRLGEVWLVDGAFQADVSKVRFSLFATGLHNPLSLFWRDRWLY